MKSIFCCLLAFYAFEIVLAVRFQTLYDESAHDIEFFMTERENEVGDLAHAANTHGTDTKGCERKFYADTDHSVADSKDALQKCADKKSSLLASICCGLETKHRKGDLRHIKDVAITCITQMKKSE